ncbi:MAG: endoplasmic oxidoreductin-1 [Pycnora praestabilis]|nr:MAG: endoplasmic oxidoreductin-1 [Pycnora praestabilis]
MWPAAQFFYLAVFALLGSSHAESKTGTKSESNSPDVCVIEPKAIVSDACASYSTLDTLNSALTPTLKSITQTTDFFAYYRLNLFNRVCPFWNDANSMCGNIACAVNTIDDEEDVPEVWRAEELGKLEGPKADHPGKRLQEERGKQRPLQGMLGEGVGESCVVEYDDECDERDYCVPEDESASAKGDYVSLVDNPEKFTGYGGPGAHQVWDAIYGENCFAKDPTLKTKAQGGTLFPSGGRQAANDLRSVMKEHGRQQAIARQADQGTVDDGLDFDDECLEKRVFYRIISGMHASISSHLCWDYLNKTTGEWGPNLECYEERLHDYPERISNLYFNYAVVLRAVGKLRAHLQNYTFCSGDIIQDRETKQKVLQLVDKVATGPQIFDESQMFQDPSVVGLKEDFRNRFRNVSRLMDCVGCDKCRLWGKLQTAGYGTALKVLFEFDEHNDKENLPLRRTELVALINTLDRISSSLSAVEKFRTMIGARDIGKPITETRTGDTVHMTGLPNVNDDDDDIQQPDEGTIWEEVLDEWYRVWRAFAFVIRSWIEFPGKAWQILLIETSRLWEFWLGLPITPRTWEIRLPSRDEI